MCSPPFRLRDTVPALLLLLVVVLLPFQGSGALARSLPVQAPSRPSAGPSDPHELERFLDQVLGKQLATQHIPGATISVVKDGRLFFAKGYGFADLQHHTPVHVTTTLFRIGSVSKLFTGTAVMQLVEQGKLDLHTDVNHYLKTFQLPATYPQPITLAHLLTHTAGFEDRAFDIWARTPGELQPLGAWLATHIPARVRPPGQLASYSNYSIALAGYIVEQVSGMPFDQYVEEKIFLPLKMTHSTFRQPVPARLAPDLSQGYQYKNGRNRVLPFEDIQIAPAGSMSTTATDMAHFMLAHLQDGRFDSQRILQEATAREMHRQHFTSDAHLPGMAYVFNEGYWNLMHTISHSGGTLAFNSFLSLLTAQQVGLFVSYNNTNGAGAIGDLVQAFLNHYFPAPRPKVLNASQLPDFTERAIQISGTYWPTRRNYSTFEKVFALLKPVQVSNAGKGRLTMTGVENTSVNLVEVSPWVFQDERGTTVVVFQPRPEGTTMFLRDTLDSYTKVAWYETITVQYALLLVCALIFLSALLFWPLQRVCTRRRRHADPPSTATRLARWLAGAVCLLNLIIVGIWFVPILTGQAEQLMPAIMFGLQPWLVAIFLLALVTALLTIGVWLCTVWLWWKRWWGPALRIHYTLVALAALAFVLELASWNLLGFRA